jgi:hypothetical protein
MGPPGIAAGGAKNGHLALRKLSGAYRPFVNFHWTSFADLSHRFEPNI